MDFNKIFIVKDNEGELELSVKGVINSGMVQGTDNEREGGEEK